MANTSLEIQTTIIWRRKPGQRMTTIWIQRLDATLQNSKAAHILVDRDLPIQNHLRLPQEVA
jgi:hypothetical protein